MARIVLTNRDCTSKARVPLPGQRAEYRNVLVPRIGVARDRQRTPLYSCLIRRRRSIQQTTEPAVVGQDGAITLEQARDEARVMHAAARGDST